MPGILVERCAHPQDIATLFGHLCSEPDWLNTVVDERFKRGLQFDNRQVHTLHAAPADAFQWIATGLGVGEEIELNAAFDFAIGDDQAILTIDTVTAGEYIGGRIRRAVDTSAIDQRRRTV